MTLRLVCLSFLNNNWQTQNMATKTYACENCKLRAHYDKNPRSLMGRFWRWHINFCPGWKAFYASLPEERKAEMRSKYNLKK